MRHIPVRNHRAARTTRRPAVVLFVVLVVTVLLALAAYGFIIAIQTDHRMSKIAADRIQTQHLLESSETVLAVWLEEPRSVRYSMETDIPIDINRMVMTVSEANQPSDVGIVRLAESTDTMVDPTAESTSVDITATPTSSPFSQKSKPLASPADSTLLPVVQNESAKLHLATILAWDKQQTGRGRAALMHLPGMTEAIADAILDWCDKDDMPREFGAERAYYVGQGGGYAPPNSIPTQLDELLFVRDITPAHLFGGPVTSLGTSLVTNASSSMPVGDTQRSDMQPRGWTHYLTVRSSERNDTWSGKPRVWVNQPSLTQLYQQLVAQVPTNVANFVVAYRQFGPTRVESQGSVLADHTPDLTQPAQYPIRSVVALIDTAINVRAQGEESIGQLASPFARNSGGSDTEVGGWLDAMTVDKEPRIDGRLNIVDAPVEILAAIPGIDAGLLDFIVSQRQNPTARENLMWLWSTTIVPHTTLESLAPWITTGGDVFVFPIHVLHLPSRTQRWGELVLDSAGPRTRRLAFTETYPDNTMPDLVTRSEYATDDAPRSAP